MIVAGSSYVRGLGAIAMVIIIVVGGSGDAAAVVIVAVLVVVFVIIARVIIRLSTQGTAHTVQQFIFIGMIAQVQI